MSNKTIYDHKKIELTNNYVLVKLDDDFEKYHIDGKETSIYVGGSSTKLIGNIERDGIESVKSVETNMNMAQNEAYSGTVISNPKKLVFNGDEIRKFVNKNSDIIFGSPSSHREARRQAEMSVEIQRMRDDSLKYKTSIETRPGDRIYFDFMEKFELYTQNRVINTDIGELVMIRYDSINFIIRDEEIIPINSTILFEWIKDVNVSDSGIVKSTDDIHISDKTHGTITGKVLHLPSPVSGLLEESNNDKYYDPVRELNVGDEFIVKRLSVMNAENDNHFVIFAGKEVFMTDSNNILAVYEKNRI